MSENLLSIDSTSHELTPEEIVNYLDRFVVGQQQAKRKVSVALRHRALRRFVKGPLQHEIMPKNILMIGPTGVGKTEIVRRLALFLKAPFIKVEATKFTEVGYVGRDVESIIRDLVEKTVKEVREKELLYVRELAQKYALTILENKLIENGICQQDDQLSERILQGEFDHQAIEVEAHGPMIDVEILAPPGMEETISQFQQVVESLSGERKKRKTLTVKDALTYYIEDESHKLLDEELVRKKAISEVESQGIVFIDEIDKVCQRRGSHSSSEISREGVQRDLLPLIEGCSVVTRYGMIRTDHILFITSGAFQLSKPSDLIAELQGRLPVRVELSPLTVSDLINILSNTDVSLIAQYQALLAVDGVNLSFTAEGIRQLAEVAYIVNERLENIGARRLHTILEALLEDVSYQPKEYSNVVVDKNFVENRLKNLLASEDLYQYIL